MRMKRIIILMILFVVINNNISAEVNYASNEEYYQKLCAKRSSFNANKSVCQGYESYLKKQQENIDNNAKSISDQIAKTKGDISKLIGIIQENQKLIEKKKVLVENTKEDIKIKQAEIVALEKDIMERLQLMQEMNGENFMLDFLMSSTSLDDFLTKMDGVNAINISNHEAIMDLDFAKKDLANQQKKLETEQKKLQNAQKEQNELLKEYRSKEAELFVKLEAEHRKKSVYNRNLNNLNVDDLATSKGFVKPVSHATVTAVAWYYPMDFGGGWHPGIDLANSTGTPILAPANGVVLLTGSGLGYGNYMVTAHQVGNDTYTFVYGHLSGFANYGNTIKQGQTIAYMGSTGNSTGPHLHFEVFKHNNKSLKSVINTYRNYGDLYFGLGYASTGSCSSVCRLKPQSFLGVKYMQVF